MEQLDTDTLALMAPSAVARLKLGCVSRRLRNALRALNAARRTRVYSAVTWFGRNMVLELVINAPVVVRIVWHTTKRMKEMRLLLPTASQTGQVLDGECNFVLYNIDVVFLEASMSKWPTRALKWCFNSAPRSTTRSARRLAPSTRPRTTPRAASS